MKKALCAVIAVIICMTFIFTGCKDNKTPNGTVVDHSSPENYASGGDTVVKSDIKIEEGETVAETSLGAETELFLASKYYLEGTIYTGDQKMPVRLATDSVNLELTATVGNISFAILVLDDQTYAINPNAQSYTELSDMLVRTLGINDLNVSEFQSIHDNGNDDANIVQNAVTINGKPGLCTDFIYEDTAIKLYSIDDKLVQVENFDNKGNLTMQIVVDSITAQIPADQLTLKGFTRQNIPSFLSSFVGG